MSLSVIEELNRRTGTPPAQNVHATPLSTNVAYLLKYCSVPVCLFQLMKFFFVRSYPVIQLSEIKFG